MISMVCARAGISPSDMQCARCQIHHNRIDRFFSVEWIQIVFRVITDGVWEIHMISQHALQAF